MKDFEMFVITHKKITKKLIKEYIPIQVGKDNTKLDLQYINDNTGDNIAQKNPYYCELTAIYWLYKNYDLPKYVGICHYRRFFLHSIFLKLIDKKYVNKIMKKYDVILPYRYDTKSSVEDNFIDAGSGKKKDLVNLRNIIKKDYSKYLNEYDKVMSSKKMSYCNMVVMKKEDFMKYCSWLFEILSKVEAITDMTGYSKQEKRLYGFLSEFLLNVWINQNRLKIKNTPIYVQKDNLTLINKFTRNIRLIIKIILNKS